jgi:hypothetical protein
MGKFVLKDASVEIDGTDEVDVSAMQSRHKETERGLSDASMSFNFFQDFEASMTDSVLWPLAESGEKFLIVVKPFSGKVSASNPAYVMGGHLFNYTPIAGGVGEASTTETPIKNATDLGIVKATDEKTGDEATADSLEKVIAAIEAAIE